MEHGRRYKKCAPDIVIHEEQPVTTTQELFLANSTNKTLFIKLLCGRLNHSGVVTSVAEGDADTLIVQTALSVVPEKNKRLVVVGEDVDLIVLLVALSNSYDSKLCLLKPGKGNVQDRVYDISDVQNSNGLLKKNILFLHAFTGCDSTSAIYQKGKVRAWKLLQKSSQLQAAIKNFNTKGASQGSIFESGCAAFLQLYGAPAEITSLNRYRYILFQRGAARNAANLKSLCPTEGAARQHSYRVYLQMQVWQGHTLSMSKWGWRKEKDMFSAVGTTEAPAPNTLLKKLYCSCQKGCAGGCGCRKLGTYKITLLVTSCNRWYFLLGFVSQNGRALPTMSSRQDTPLL